MEKQELKELLIKIDNNNNEVPHGINQHELSILMMDNIGDTDSELRDNLILSILSDWIINGKLPDKVIHELLTKALDEKHLLNGLGEINDTVFSRTFSAEIVAAIIYKHRQQGFLSESDVQRAFNVLLNFYNTDKDIRGFVDEKGWAHGAAHGADALDELCRCKEIRYEELKKILAAIYKKVNVNYYGYIHSEDDRMITPVKGVLERNIIPLEEIEEWISSFKNIEKTDEAPKDQVIYFNVTTFLKSLYFRLIDVKEYKGLANKTKETLKEISKFSAQ